MYMENWSKLTLSEKERLVGQYSLTAIGNPPEPKDAVEYAKVPQEEWDALIQKEKPSRKKKKRKSKEAKEPKVEVKEVKEVKKEKKIVKKSKSSKK